MTLIITHQTTPLDRKILDLVTNSDLFVKSDEGEPFYNEPGFTEWCSGWRKEDPWWMDVIYWWDGQWEISICHKAVQFTAKGTHLGGLWEKAASWLQKQARNEPGAADLIRRLSL